MQLDVMKDYLDSCSDIHEQSLHCSLAVLQHALNLAKHRFTSTVRLGKPAMVKKSA